jgi:hypothetical protein
MLPVSDDETNGHKKNYITKVECCASSQHSPNALRHWTNEERERLLCLVGAGGAGQKLSIWSRVNKSHGATKYQAITGRRPIAGVEGHLCRGNSPVGHGGPSTHEPFVGTLRLNATLTQ